MRYDFSRYDRRVLSLERGKTAVAVARLGAFLGDRLITVELGRSATGASFTEPTLRSWEPDKAVA
jgi:hypothetical protein